MSMRHVPVTYSVQESSPGEHGLIASPFHAARTELGMTCVRSAVGRVPANAWSTLLGHANEVIAHVARSARSGGGFGSVVRIDDALIVLRPGEGSEARLTVAARTPEAVDRATTAIAEVIDRLGNESLPYGTEVRMWRSTRYRILPKSEQRFVAAPDDETIEEGLPRHTRDAVSELRRRGPREGGVHIWHGPPGCGKTTAIRGLARAWQHSANVEVILDPAAFLGDVDYAMHVLDAADPMRSLSAACAEAERHDKLRRVLILEDAGELVGADAQTAAGGGLSRLLNLTDGMFGEAHRPVVIITTNEPIGKLHPALTRPGRCRSIVEFGPLPEHEALAWLRRRECSAKVTGAMSIAELAALADDTSPIGLVRAQEPVGFAP